MKNLFYGEKHSFIEWTYVVGAHWNGLYEFFFKYTLNKYHVHLPSSFKHLKLPISI